MKTVEIQDNREKLICGINKAANIITSSMGAKGNTVIVSASNGELLITKDGVSIAKQIHLPDPIENIGAKLLISAAQETVKQTGDGTTLTSLLLQKMLEHTTDVKKLEEEVTKLKDWIKTNSREITTSEQIASIAKTSSNSDYVAQLIKEIYEKTSHNVHIEVEQTEDPVTTYTVEDGYKLPTGFDDAWQITNRETQQVVFKNPTFYITEEPLHHTSTKIKELVKLAMQNDMALVFVAQKFSREFKLFIQAQIMGGKAKLLTLKTSELFGDDKVRYYEGLRAYLSEDSTADEIISNPYYTIIKSSEHNAIDQKLEEFRQISKTAIDPLDAKNALKHYQELSGNIATIWVGGKTKEEIKELYDRIEDAVGATKTATKSGYVPGMGSTLDSFSRKKSIKYKEIWQSPIFKITENAGLNITNDQVLLEDYGYDLNTGEHIDLLEKGIIDPTNTLLVALDNALANTKLVLNTKYIMYNEL